MTQHGYPHMVLEEWVRRLRRLREVRSKRLRALRSRRAAERQRDQIRRVVGRAFSPRPRRTALKARVLDTLVRGGYRIEKTVFQSRPGCLVTANLYFPDGLCRPAPGVIGTCGHSMEGKACALYHGFAQRLARNGFVVLLYDPFNQGERDQYHGVPDRDCVRGCCAAHNMMGKQLELLGESFGMWRAWDGMRALDYLLSRPEVDARHVGVTGNSGGGTMTEWLWAVDDRFTMAAPSCFVSTYMANLENELPQDCEQYPPGILGVGLEMVDLMMAQAPKPVLLLGQTFDFFDRRGLREAHRDLQRFYGLYDATDDAELFVGPQTHGYSVHNQEAMVEFFCRRSGLGAPVAVDEDEIPPEALQVLPEGNTVAAGARPVFVFIDRLAGKRVAGRRTLDGEGLRRRLRSLLSLPRRSGTPHYRVLRPASADGGRVARYGVETEGGIQAILRKRLVRAERAFSLDVETDVRLLVPHLSAEEELSAECGTMGSDMAHALYAVDVRGLGESIPEVTGADAFFAPYGMDYMMHGFGILFGESYLGRRVFDLLRVMDLLAAEGAETIHLHGRGQGAILATFGGLLHAGTASVTLRNAPLAFREWTRVPLLRWPAANCLRGVLRAFDLPDCYRALPGLRLIEPWGPDMTPLAAEQIAEQAACYGIDAEVLG